MLALKISFSPACTLSSALTVGGEWGKQRIVCMSEQPVCVFLRESKLGAFSYSLRCHRTNKLVEKASF